MKVYKVRNEKKVRIYLNHIEMKIFRTDLENYIRAVLLQVAKQRRWKWYLNKEKK